ncbi:hypothetical protein [Sphingobacterium hotanense]|uniref:hypothetical protein n=1 Tax=Sphingobacterium hotanense TaxID=649196 RepID=UPI0021A69DEC|nr:hypothetical protein [Sphingobacterium hotanense]MCT1524385.1 hypothetical protein [Sphingobacterium hotanense]
MILKLKAKLKSYTLTEILVVCFSNISYHYEKLPFGGYEFGFEGGNQNRMFKNQESLIDSELVDCKYISVYPKMIIITFG